MGLDMEIKRISKPNYDSSRIYNSEEIDGIVLSKEEIEYPMYSQLAPYCQEIKVRSKYFDTNKIWLDYKFSDFAHICQVGSSGITVFDPQKRNKFIKISNDLVEGKYTLEKIEDCLVCLSEEVRYWRKAYEIQEWFYENLSNDIENTGYYMMGELLQEDFNEAWPDEAIEIEYENEESALFYWEWY